MKKIRFLSIVLALILTLPAVLFGSFAEEDPVAQIGTTTYQSLSEAISAATEGQTVEVLRDCEIPGATFSHNIVLKAKDGLEKTPTITTTQNLIPGTEVELTVENLSFYSTETVFQINNSCVLNLKNCNVESKGYYCIFFGGMAATVNINGGSYKSNYAVVFYNGDQKPADGMYLNVTDATLEAYDNLRGNYAVISNLNYSQNIYITIDHSKLIAKRTDKAKVAAEGACIKIGDFANGNLAVNNHVTIKGGSELISNYEWGVVFYGDANSSLTVEKGTVTREPVGDDDGKFNEPTNKAALWVRNKSTKVEIKEGSFNAPVVIEYVAQTVENSPFEGRTVYAQLTKGTTAESASAGLRFAVQLKNNGYTKMGFIVSVKNQTLFVDLDGNVKTETTGLYDSVWADGVKVGVEQEGEGWLAAGVDAIPDTEFSTEIRIRPYAYSEESKTYILGDTYTLTVNELIEKSAA